MSVYHQDKVLIFVVKSNVIPKLEMLFKKKRKKERKKKKTALAIFLISFIENMTYKQTKNILN